MEFISSVLFTDGETFTRIGFIKLHNHHLCANENSREMVEASHQHLHSINIWAGIIGEHLLGPVILPKRINGRTEEHTGHPSI